MVIFESFLASFEASNIFKAVGVVVEIDFSLKPNHHNQVKIFQICGTHFKYYNCYWLQFQMIWTNLLTREHWTGEVLADKWVPVFPLYNWPFMYYEENILFLQKQPILTGTHL